MTPFIISIHSMFHAFGEFSRTVGRSMFNVLFLFLFLLAASIAPAQPERDKQDSEIVIVLGGQSILRWYGHPNRSYFIQVSDQNNPLGKWNWAPIIEAGIGAEISHQIGGLADKAFFRLSYTGITPGPGETLDTADFDGDSISNWNEIKFYQTDPLNSDTDSDGLEDGDEIWSFQSDPNNPDSDGDGLSDGDEVWIYGTSPTAMDSDGEGLADGVEVHQTHTSPTNADTDGDGVSDMDEINQGTDPNSATSFDIAWRRITRTLTYDFNDYTPLSNTGTLNLTAEWDTSQNISEELNVAIPFTDLKGRLESLVFPPTLPSYGWTNARAPSEGYSNLIPNPPCFHATMNHQRLWLRRGQTATTAFQQRAFIVTKRSIDGTDQALTFESKTLTVPANETISSYVDLDKGFTQNFAGNTFHSESFNASLCPLEITQQNMPNIGVAENSTDLGGKRSQAMIGIGGIAYITGEPAVPQLRARFRDMPAAVSVEWRLELRSERPERGTLDDRNYPTQGYVTLTGDQEWNITAAMAGEFVGGECTLLYRLNGANANSITFILRGKNPLDAPAKAQIDATVGASFTAYAWGMAKHESRFGPRAFNQFNAGVTNGTPYYGAPNGWGMCQIDRPVGNPGVTTAEVWNWHTNVAAMKAKLVGKQADYNRFIGYFRASYGTHANWSEPPASHTIGATTLPAEAWGVMVRYNGGGGVPTSTTPTHPTPPFGSPWIFNPTTGVWTFNDNQTNYASGRVRPELEGTVNTQE